MKKIKNCNYCHHHDSTVKKYKTVFNKFGQAKQKVTNDTYIHRTSIPLIYRLCDVCFDTLVPEQYRIGSNGIDDDFSEKNLRCLFPSKISRLTPVAFNRGHE